MTESDFFFGLMCWAFGVICGAMAVALYLVGNGMDDE